MFIIYLFIKRKMLLCVVKEDVLEGRGITVRILNLNTRLG